VTGALAGLHVVEVADAACGGLFEYLNGGKGGGDVIGRLA
jgi:hypothetical protein